MKKFDVIVVGGGFAGVAAALAASRGGCKTLLIEKSNALGGAANNNQVNPFMKYFYTLDGEDTILCRGIFREIISNLKAMKAIEERQFFHDEYLKLILNRMVINENIELRFHSYLIDSKCINGNIKSVTVANKQGKFRNPRHNVGVTRYITKNTLNFNTTRITGKNPLNAKDLTYAEIEAREQIFEIFEFLKENADGMEKAEIFTTAASIGVRESRRIIGDYVLQANDIISCRKFKDAIAAGNYNIDIHNPTGSGTYHYVIPDGNYYTVPYRCLIPVSTENLLTAGRCISATHEAIASVRIMPIVCCIGECAGTAAALAKKHQTTIRNVNISELQKTLKDNGVFF